MFLGLCHFLHIHWPNLLFSSLTSAPELSLAWECYAITSLNMPTDTHFTLTSAVRWTKCGLENEWQPLKIINYASAKLLAHVHRAGLALRVGHTPPYGMCKNGHRLGVQRYTPEILTDIYFCPGHRRYTTYVVRRCRTSRLHCLDDCCWEISTVFWSICYPLTHSYWKWKCTFARFDWKCECCSK